jgi:NADPH:quinone reductase-like Zn-dependent oxidoreductase
MMGFSTGLTPIATCSPKNSALVMNYGAEQVFDYDSPTCAADIRTYTKNSLCYALDIITSPTTLQLCYSAIGRAGGKYTALELPPTLPGLRKTVKSDWMMGISGVWKGYRLGEWVSSAG